MRAEDPLAKVRSKLEDLDIKTIIPYLVDHTSYVVQNKRNTAKGLQALINGKAIVNDSFIDALVYATTPTDLENDEAMSPLEIDFGAAWPNAIDYLPPAGSEPVARPADAFAPNPSRATVFEGYTFVFGDKSQFDNLQAAINNGHGKALFYEIRDGATTAEEIVRFMNEASGGRGVGSERQARGGVVLVRFRSKGEYEPWSIELGNEIALMTDQRVIEQREFLDAILGNDASPLCRSLPREEAPSNSSVPAPAPTSPPAPAPAPRSRPASKPGLRHQQSHSTSGSPLSQPPESQSFASQSQSQSSHAKAPPKFVSKMQNFDDGFDMESIPAYASEDDEPTAGEIYTEPSQPVPQIRSQPAAEAEEIIEEDMVADLLPGARAMKRRRNDMSSKRTKSGPVEPEPAPKRKRPKLDVLEEARKHREEEEQQQQRDAGTPDHQSEAGNIEGLRNLAIIEEMELPVRDIPMREEEASDRWDDRWNGRKYFKRFRRKGEPRTRNRIHSVIVPLEEVTRKGYGIGEHYWSNTRKSPEKDQSPDEEEQVEASEEDVPPSRAPSRSVASVALSASPEPTPAPSLPSRTQSQKRPRPRRGSDSDEELRFRFRRKR